MPGGGNASIDLATRPVFAPSDAWCESLDWLRMNTPEPLGDPNAYYELSKQPSEPGGYVTHRDAYGVLAWWDYGYWITRIGRRIPFSNPGTSGVNGEAKYFLAEDETTSIQFFKNKDINIKYVIVDDEIASYDSKLLLLLHGSADHTRIITISIYRSRVTSTSPASCSILPTIRPW